LFLLATSSKILKEPQTNNLFKENHFKSRKFLSKTEKGKMANTSKRTTNIFIQKTKII
jgi:hypothetical protein